eukprot:TRINITY_DN8241_c0_g1_i1.p1 TRINITY_DN8241_c0_g1~~TRINITY_DN8241_c0_g1_i1.p1  ORF type:complete len:160 (+),score=34.31 TRINITY_DN8241_c0_g1_i1:3-482(+)
MVGFLDDNPHMKEYVLESRFHSTLENECTFFLLEPPSSFQGLSKRVKVFGQSSSVESKVVEGHPYAYDLLCDMLPYAKIIPIALTENVSIIVEALEAVKMIANRKEHRKARKFMLCAWSVENLLPEQLQQIQAGIDSVCEAGVLPICAAGNQNRDISVT